MPDSIDPYNLQRFIDAQQPVYMQVLSELRAGHKQTHWIWFIFPQLSGLGHSATARYFAIQSLDEARTYLRHPTLGRRLRDCTELINQFQYRAVEEILGPVDALKFRSCMTLFLQAAEEDSIFLVSLKLFFAGQLDSPTLNLLNRVAINGPIV